MMQNVEILISPKVIAVADERFSTIGFWLAQLRSFLASHLWKVANESLSHKEVKLLFPIFGEFYAGTIKLAISKGTTEKA